MVEATSVLYVCVIGACLCSCYLWQNTPLAFGNVQFSLKLQLCNMYLYVHIEVYSRIYAYTRISLAFASNTSTFFLVGPNEATGKRWLEKVKMPELIWVLIDFDCLILNVRILLKAPHIWTSLPKARNSLNFFIYSILKGN